MKLLEFRAVRKGEGVLRGFAAVELPIGLTIRDCPVCESNGKAWAGLPAKAQLDRDGRQIVSDGKAQYAAVLKWRTRDLADRFSDAIIALVRAEHPDTFDKGSAP